MHIVRISHAFSPSAIGDPFNSCALSLRQAKRGHTVSVFTWNKNKRPSFEVLADNLLLRRLPGLNFRLGNMIIKYPYLPTLPENIRKTNFDVLHAHSHLFLTTVQAVREAKKLEKPSIVTVHGVLAWRDPLITSAQYAYLYSAGSWIFKNATSIICLTRSDAHEVARFGCPQEKIRIIPNAVDTELFRPRPDQEEDGMILWAGRFVREKGLEYLIEAAKEITARHHEVKLILAGDGPQRPKIMSLAHEFGLNESIIFTGALPKEQIAELLGKASIFVLPSLKEGLPKALLEAMAAGKAVVASDIPGVDEIIENHRNGLLVPPKNSERMAEAIAKLLIDGGLRERIGSEARRLVLKRYGWDGILDRIESAYREAMVS